MSAASTKRNGYGHKALFQGSVLNAVTNFFFRTVHGQKVSCGKQRPTRIIKNNMGIHWEEKNLSKKDLFYLPVKNNECLKVKSSHNSGGFTSIESVCCSLVLTSLFAEHNYSVCASFTSHFTGFHFLRSNASTSLSFWTTVMQSCLVWLIEYIVSRLLSFCLYKCFPIYLEWNPQHWVFVSVSTSQVGNL